MWKIGQLLSDAEAARLLGCPKKGGGWFRDEQGRDVYICDGSHRDGTRGFKVLQIGGY